MSKSVNGRPRAVLGGCGLVGIAVAALLIGPTVVADDAPVGGPGHPDRAPAPGAKTPGDASGKKKAPDFPPFEKVSDGLEKVVSTADGKKSLYTLYANKKDGRLLAILPSNYANQLVMIANTVAAGNEDAGVMGNSIYAKWKRYDKRLALVEPNFLVRSTGDKQSKTSVKTLFTDRVILDVPIVAMGPGGGPVIDLKALMAGQHAHFFGPMSSGYGPMVFKGRSHLAALTKAKAFPENIEVTYELPDASGRLVSLHYSIRDLPKNESFEPREADNRVGYFNVYYNDLGKTSSADETYTRYIARWQIEKADPKLALSPPKQPLVWYIEHTTPVRYRRFVRDGILEWNKAYEAIGIVNALEVYQQDAVTGAHMDKDPEDARFNFFRWNTSTQGYAIGPSRWDPRTGEILDADVVWHAGLTRAVASMYSNLTAEIAVQGMTPETLAWLDANPQWDPRVRLASPAKRERTMAEHRRHQTMDLETAAFEALGDTEAMQAMANPHRAIAQAGSACRIGEYLAMNIGLFAAGLDAGMFDVNADDPVLDDLPEAFLGAMIKYISSHEVGHTLGLQHNFAGSTIRSLEEINSEAMAGEPFIASVMEYAGVNINMDDGEIQGHYATPGIGPYDYWAIAYGYGPKKDLESVLARVAEPDHVFLNDLSSIGPDPRAQVWDMGADPLNFAESRLRIIRDLRGRIIDDIVKDGDSWKKARDRYQALLSNHMLAVVVSSRWVGGSFVHWDYKGDPGDRDPIENVPSDVQRRALRIIIDNVFDDDAFGLTPELLHKLSLHYYPDAPGMKAIFDDPSFEVHDMVGGVQAAALTMIMNPTKLRRIYDNEFRAAGTEDDVITMAEVLGEITESIWGDLDGDVSSFRRNLQREHVERLIALSMPGQAASPSMRTLATLSTLSLRQLRDKIDAVDAAGDPYTHAHLEDVKMRIDKALDAIYVYGR